MIEIWDTLLLVFFATCVVIYGAFQLQFDQDLFKSETIFTLEHKVFLNFGFGLFILVLNIPYVWGLIKDQGDHWVFASYLVLILS